MIEWLELEARAKLLFFVRELVLYDIITHKTILPPFS